jgi:hypothetical protein
MYNCFMKTIQLALALLATSAMFLGLAQGISHAATLRVDGPSVTADFAKDSLPPCSRASMAIFNGAAFDGVVYLHNKDLAFDGSVIQVVRAIAAQGEIPALCQVNGLTFVTLASR